MTRLRRPLAPLGALAAFALLLGLAGCAGGATASPESAARTFLEAMKANSLSAAMALIHPTTGGQALVMQAEVTFTAPDAEQAASPTGLTGYEIIDQVTNERGAVLITAELTGSSIPEITLRLAKGGPTGEDWFVENLDPGFQMLEVGSGTIGDGSVTLAGGTVVPETALYVRMLPGSDLTGFTWADAEGYYDPVELKTKGTEATPQLSLDRELLRPTDKLMAAAQASFDDVLEKGMDRAMAAALADPGLIRVISEPSAGEWEHEVRYGTVYGTMEVDQGEVQACEGTAGFLPGSEELRLRSFTFAGDLLTPGPSAAHRFSLAFQPYGWDVSDPPIETRPFDSALDSAGLRLTALARCGA